jgi:hypothetical protein
LEKNYYFIPENDHYIAIEKSSLSRMGNLNDIILSKNNFSNSIWHYKKKSSGKKGLIIHLDIFVSNAPIKFSYNGVLMFKEYKNYIFGIFTNNFVQHYRNVESEIKPVEESIFKSFPDNLLTGIFCGMYKNGKKSILCLDVDKCFAAYKHFM